MRIRVSTLILAAWSGAILASGAVIPGIILSGLVYLCGRKDWRDSEGITMKEWEIIRSANPEWFDRQVEAVLSKNQKP